MNDSIKQGIESTSPPKLKYRHQILKLFFEHPLSVGLFIAVIGGVIATVVGGIILKKIYP
jgi:hypothetical protein